MLRFKVAYALVILGFQIDLFKCEIYTSYEEMRKLFDTQHEVTRRLDDYIKFEEDRLRKAKDVVENFRSFSQISKIDQENFIGNPVNSFLVLKLMVKDIQRFVDLLNTIDDLKKMVSELKERYNLPGDEDYEGVIKGMHRLEDTYLLNPSDIRTGSLSMRHTSRALNAFECFELGRIAYENKDYYHAIRWMNESLIQVELEGNQPSIDKVEILDYYAFSTAKQGNIKHAIDLTKQIIELEPDHERAEANLKYFEKALKDYKKLLQGDNGDNLDLSNNPFVFKNPRPEHVLGSEREIYESLCRGDYKPSRKQKNLHCRYISYNPLLKIAPVKEELVHDKPKIWLYHDVITEKQIEIMKELATPKLRRAIVRSPVTGKFETAEYRISKSGWLTDREHPSLNYLTKLVKAVTNLTMETAEEWQIANYGIGGQYEPHFDFARKTEPRDAFSEAIGNRIATWLFYLETPEVGGATVFPPVGARVNPTKRSAAFWYNLHPSGDGDYRTRHAACPVLYGTKWVSNKWIHMVGQEFVRPCNLFREESPEKYL
ncbi:unnamed protein product [Brachionus calyciflorus]|uniref:procollagen-proline 4-dioxygenase n=1 Tax=Brachionus calyciflorus TaxID=104777 RepID=A0A813MG04_9BILA|nr:unnamed protein product [Brachionus calyciflorus]